VAMVQRPAAAAGGSAMAAGVASSGIRETTRAGRLSGRKRATMDKQQGFSSLLATDSTDRRSPVRIRGGSAAGAGLAEDWRHSGPQRGSPAAQLAGVLAHSRDSAAARGSRVAGSFCQVLNPMW
jgi:hypothetical protein